MYLGVLRMIVPCARLVLNVEVKQRFVSSVLRTCVGGFYPAQIY
jgi:hypothetical protein